MATKETPGWPAYKHYHPEDEPEWSCLACAFEAGRASRVALSGPELDAALRNVAVDPECGGCMQLFWTGDASGSHEKGCRAETDRNAGRKLTEADRVDEMAAVIEQAVLDIHDLRPITACQNLEALVTRQRAALAAERAKETKT